MFRYAKPFGQALRPEPANTKYRRPARNLWLLHGRGLHPQTPVRASPSPPWPERPTVAPLPYCRPMKKAQPLDAIGDSTMTDVAEGGTVAPMRYSCPVLRRSASRSRSTATSQRRGARRTTPHDGHLRALISRYSVLNERQGRDHDAEGIAWRGPTL